MPDYTIGTTKLDFSSPVAHVAHGHDKDNQTRAIVFHHGPIAPVGKDGDVELSSSSRN